jgi:hypothetical protein
MNLDRLGKKTFSVLQDEKERLKFPHCVNKGGMEYNADLA